MNRERAWGWAVVFALTGLFTAIWGSWPWTSIDCALAALFTAAAIRKPKDQD